MVNQYDLPAVDSFDSISSSFSFYHDHQEQRPARPRSVSPGSINITVSAGSSYEDGDVFAAPKRRKPNEGPMHQVAHEAAARTLSTFSHQGAHQVLSPARGGSLAGGAVPQRHHHRPPHQHQGSRSNSPFIVEPSFLPQQQGYSIPACPPTTLSNMLNMRSEMPARGSIGPMVPFAPSGAEASLGVSGVSGVTKKKISLSDAVDDPLPPTMRWNMPPPPSTHTSGGDRGAAAAFVVPPPSFGSSSSAMRIITPSLPLNYDYPTTAPFRADRRPLPYDGPPPARTFVGPAFTSAPAPSAGFMPRHSAGAPATSSRAAFNRHTAVADGNIRPKFAEQKQAEEVGRSCTTMKDNGPGGLAGGPVMVRTTGRCTRFEVKPGQFDQKVGLLNGQQPPELYKYLSPNEGGPPLPPRAPREDLSHLSPAARMERHRHRARGYSQVSRDKKKKEKEDAVEELGKMDIYRWALELAPNMMMVLSADADCRVLYSNAMIQEILGISADKTLGSSFLDLIHTDSRSPILALLNACIFTPTAPKEIVRCFMRCAGSSPSKFKEVTVSVNLGTQGVVCSIYDVV